MIAISRELDPSDAGRAALSTLVTALVFWLAHVYARLLGDRRHAPHEHDLAAVETGLTHLLRAEDRLRQVGDDATAVISAPDANASNAAVTRLAGGA